ncbi:unnamed protein product [Urochloa decumbens]|uniref:Uncharacterized protein n=1 Tax=Urochloa decumbens TaxID=240449 RepID=A0ABC9HI06_9POAL
MRQPPMWPLLLLLPAFLAATAADASGIPPAAPPMTPWPERYHAVLVTNLTARGGRLEVFDTYYDWARGGDLTRVREQLAGGGDPPARIVQWANGTAYQIDAAASSCRAFQFATGGLLPPDWKKARAGAAYLGRARADGFDCHVWSNRLFARYYEDVATGRPVAWKFTGIDEERHVLSFEPGRVLEDSSMWQAPAYCFDGSNGGDGQGSSRAHLLVSSRLAGATGAAASFGQ